MTHRPLASERRGDRDRTGNETGRREQDDINAPRCEYCGRHRAFRERRGGRAKRPSFRVAKQYGLGYLQMMVMEDMKLVEKHTKAAGLGDVTGELVHVPVQRRHERRPALRQPGLCVAGDERPGHHLGQDEGHAGRGEGRSGLQLPAASAGHPRSQRQDRRGLHREAQDRRPGGPRLQPGHPAPDGGGQAVRAGQLHQAGLPHRLHDASGRRWRPCYPARGRWAATSPRPRSCRRSWSGRGFARSSAPPRFWEATINFNILATTTKFREGNPKAYGAYLDAMQEATDVINKDKRAAAELYIRMTKDKSSVDDILKIMNASGEYNFNQRPEGICE